VVLGCEAYAFASDAPSPRVAPIISILGIVIAFSSCRAALDVESNMFLGVLRERDMVSTALLTAIEG